MASDAFGWVGHDIDGRYRVERVVGEGGFGVVYKAKHLGFGDEVAVKCLKVPGSFDEPARARFREAFLEEGRLLRQLSRATSNVVQALDTGDAMSPSGAWTPYLVLEWLEGEPLDAHLGGPPPRGPMPVERAVALLEPAARALGVAHAMGVAHRDIKPQNLFVSRVAGATTLKVLDFGIAKVMSFSTSLTQALSATGAAVSSFTPAYGAPEQFNRRFGATGPWTDVFALALVLVELCSGRQVLEGDDLTQLYIAASDTAHRPGLRSLGVPAPDGVEAAVQKALAVEPKDRFLSATAFWDALDAALGIAPARPASHSQPALVPAPGAPSPQASAFEATQVAPATPPASAMPATPPASPNPATRPSPAQAPASAGAYATLSGAATLPAAPPGQGPSTTTPLMRATIPDPPSAPAPAHQARRSSLPKVAAFALVAAAIGAGLVGAVALSRRDERHGRRADHHAAVAPHTASSPHLPAAAPPPEGMVRVEAGSFVMGSEGEGKTERPAHTAVIGRDFFLDRTEVTVAEYRKCVSAGKCPEPSIHGGKATPQDVEKFAHLCNYGKPGRDGHPVNCVDRAQAEAFCRFAGKRLPTEAEWEKAARGGDERMFPWGKEAPACSRAAVSSVGAERCQRPEGTSDVGSFPQGAAASGALDMAGNVWEWVDDGWDPNAYARKEAQDPHVPLTGPTGVLRGGSWDFASITAKTTYRLPFDRSAGHVSTGVRCARSAEPAAR